MPAMTALEIYTNKYKYAVKRPQLSWLPFPLHLQISILTTAIIRSVQERSLNEVRCKIKMCFTMSSGSHKCPLAGVIGLFNKTVIPLKSFMENQELRIEVI